MNTRQARKIRRGITAAKSFMNLTEDLAWRVIEGGLTVEEVDVILANASRFAKAGLSPAGKRAYVHTIATETVRVIRASW